MISVSVEKPSLESYKALLLQRRQLRAMVQPDALEAFRKEFSSKKRKPDLSKASKYTNKVKAFSSDQVDSLISQMDVLNLNKFDNEIAQAIMTYLNEGKKIKESDIPQLAKFIVEFIRRYPSGEEDLSALFQEAFKGIGVKTVPAATAIKKSVILTYCELCLCGIVAKENVVGKMIKVITDLASVDNADSSIYCDVLYSFVKLYGYEYISIYPAFITSEATIREDLKDFSPILSPVIQSRFLTIFDGFYNTILGRANKVWSAYSEAKKTQVHQEALRGSVPEAVNQQVKEGKERMETLKAELHLLSFYMCRDEPEFVEEEIEIKSGFEGLSITTFDNTTSNYNGPFADREEHIFYTVVPKLEELLPSLHLNRGKKTDSDKGSDDGSDSEFEDEAKIEDEMKRLDAELPAGATMEEDDEEDALVPHNASEHVAKEVSVTSLTTATQQEKAEILMERLLECFSSEEVDRWCLEFCDFNNAVSRQLLLDTIRFSYVRHRENQRYFARAIRELKPVFEALSEQVETFVRNRFFATVETLTARSASSLLSIASFITELVRFRVSSPSLFFWCLHKLWVKRNIDTIQAIALLVERLGPLLLFVEQTASLMNKELDHIANVCRNNVVDSDCSAILMNAYYCCRPAEQPKVKRVKLPPAQRYLRHLLTECVAEKTTDAELTALASHILRFNLKDDNVMLLVVMEVLRAPSEAFTAIETLARLVTILCHSMPKIRVFLIDAIFEQLCFLLEFMPNDSFQDAMSLIEFVGWLYIYKVIHNNHIFFILYLLIEYGHYVTPEVRERYSFLPQRTMAVHPLVPFEKDSPFSSVRPKMAIQLVRLVGGYLPKTRLKAYFLYLQHYFLSKEGSDLSALYDYQTMLGEFESLVTEYKSYEEVDTVVAEVERILLEKGIALKPHTAVLTLRGEEEEDKVELEESEGVEKTTTESEGVEKTASERVQEEVKKKEDEMFEKKYAEQMKGSVGVSGNKRVNLDNMAIPMNLQGSGSKEFKLLVKTKGAVSVAGSVNIEISEKQRERKMAVEKKMLREQKELKSKTIRLVSKQDNNVADAPLQSIHNDRVPVCPQANARRSGRKGGSVLFCVCLIQRSAAFDLAERLFTIESKGRNSFAKNRVVHGGIRDCFRNGSLSLFTNTLCHS